MLSSLDLRYKAAYEASCTPCTLLTKTRSCEEHDGFYGEPSTAERSAHSQHLASSCSTHFYLDEALSPSSLTCEEALEGSPCGSEDDTAMHLLVERSNSAPLLSSSGSAGCRNSVARMIMHEARRQEEVRPSCAYLERHRISEHMRSVAVNWLSEVTHACNLLTATLVLATSYFDRFLSVAKDVTSCMLQLIAVAALSLATKQEEVLQPTSIEWAAIADNAFAVEDLVRMEWIMFHHLSWRGRTPTALGFLNLYACGLDVHTVDVLKTARYLVELSILDFKLLQHDYSTIGAAALLVAHQSHHVSIDPQSLLALAPFLSLPDVDSCSKALWKLHVQASETSST